MDTIDYLHNFATGKMDARADAPATDEEAKQYIPQNATAQNLYMACRLMGKSILDAMTEVLLASVEPRR